MADELPAQSEWLYRSPWTPAMDFLLLGTMTRMKSEDNWDGTVFPSVFILEAEYVIKNAMGYDFDWATVLDRLHFLERRYKTFNEMLQYPGTEWDARTNLVKSGDAVWADMLQRNPLVGAYHTHGDPAYNMLEDLFARRDVKNEPEKTLILLSDSPDSYNNDFVFRNKNMSTKAETKAVNRAAKQGDHIRKKLVFEDDYPPDRLSSNNKGRVYYICGDNGKMTKKLDSVPVRGSASRQLQPPVQTKLPANSSDSNSPIMWWRMPCKPPM